MKIGIVGPNRIFNGNLEKTKELICEVARMIAESGHEIVLTPDKDSLLVYFGEKFLEYGGKKVNLVIPLDDDYEKYLDVSFGKIVSCSMWNNQPRKFNEISDMFICIGYAWGGMSEIACTQYFNKIKTYVLKEFVSEELPEELNFLIEYIKIEELPGVLISKT